MNRRRQNEQRTHGFTIAELLIVVVVIVILAAITVTTYKGVQGRAYDARRLSDMQLIVKNLAAYKLNNGSYPPVAYGAGTSYSGWESSALEPAGEFIKPLATSNYGLAGGVPVDPINTGGSGGFMYLYYVYPAGNAGCDSARGAYYVLGIVRTSGYGTGAHPSSPGFSCPSRNWQSEFSWVTGGYTN